MQEDEKTEKKPLKPKPNVNIRLIKPGAKSCGEYIAGQIYAVEGNEADRLVGSKGFEVVTAAEVAEAEKADTDTNNT